MTSAKYGRATLFAKAPIERHSEALLATAADACRRTLSYINPPVSPPSPGCFRLQIISINNQTKKTTPEWQSTTPHHYQIHTRNRPFSSHIFDLTTAQPTTPTSNAVYLNMCFGGSSRRRTGGGMMGGGMGGGRLGARPVVKETHHHHHGGGMGDGRMGGGRMGGGGMLGGMGGGRRMGGGGMGRRRF